MARGGGRSNGSLSALEKVDGVSRQVACLANILVSVEVAGGLVRKGSAGFTCELQVTSLLDLASEMLTFTSDIGGQFTYCLTTVKLT